MLYRILLIATAVWIVGCAKTRPKTVDLTGRWVSIERQDTLFMIEFDRDHRFVRRFANPHGSYLTVGEYEATEKTIRLFNVSEGTTASKEPVSGRFLIPYSLEGGQLVLYPGSQRQQALIRAR
jgi:hypothetical protein